MDRVALILFLGHTQARSLKVAADCDETARRIMAEEEIAHMERLAQVCAGKVRAHEDELLIVRALLPGHGPPRGRMLRVVWRLARVLDAVVDALR